MVVLRLAGRDKIWPGSWASCRSARTTSFPSACAKRCSSADTRICRCGAVSAPKITPPWPARSQEPKLLVLDEPGMSLDLKHEMGLFELVRGLVVDPGLGVLMITHDLNLAAALPIRCSCSKVAALSPPV